MPLVEEAELAAPGIPWLEAKEAVAAEERGRSLSAWWKSVIWEPGLFRSAIEGSWQEPW